MLDRGTRWRFERIDDGGSVVERFPWRQTSAEAAIDGKCLRGWLRAELETFEVDQARWAAQDRANGL